MESLLSLDISFRSKIRYVQRQDLHLPATTVKEAPQFSEILRQPKAVSKQVKYRYVDDAVDMLDI